MPDVYSTALYAREKENVIESRGRRCARESTPAAVIDYMSKDLIRENTVAHNVELAVARARLISVTRASIVSDRGD